ncbi:hypothetical protein TUSST3_40670 [Streptomyces sp. TUS-ST3]|uniref:extracellular solute-binding protein n=1 Tax=Streptomyces sp. TUS-ST3 TaxID=3025591 RepID=UPI00235B3171|nr:extracellular solute-binding protein [Streptomyces sp. TUS-ST3]GLP67445.1 hypothetical protein TUSST3_40670 [Streptomyces sp. TUS-ST3]
MHKTLRARRTALLATAATASLLPSACGGGNVSGSDVKAFSLTINDDNHIVQQELTALGKGSYASQNKALPLKIQTLPIGNVDQKAQLLARQNALPVQIAAGGTPQPTKTLDKAGQVLDLEKTPKDLGVWNSLQPAAVKTVENLYGKFNVMPYQFNIEGLWYNKTLFADHHVAIPTTYDQLVAAAAKFKAAGVTAFSADGTDGWPITRLVSGYLYRELGTDALQAVADGKVKLTDPRLCESRAGHRGSGQGRLLRQGRRIDRPTARTSGPTTGPLPGPARPLAGWPPALLNRVQYEDGGADTAAGLKALLGGTAD